MLLFYLLFLSTHSNVFAKYFYWALRFCLPRLYISWGRAILCNQGISLPPFPIFIVVPFLNLSVWKSYWVIRLLWITKLFVLKMYLKVYKRGIETLDLLFMLWRIKVLWWTSRFGSLVEILLLEVLNFFFQILGSSFSVSLCLFLVNSFKMGLTGYLWMPRFRV